MATVYQRYIQLGYVYDHKTISQIGEKVCADYWRRAPAINLDWRDVCRVIQKEGDAEFAVANYPEIWTSEIDSIINEYFIAKSKPKRKRINAK